MKRGVQLRKGLFILLLLSLVMIIFPSNTVQSKQVELPVIDVQNLTDDGSVNLDGQWLYFEGLVDSKEIEQRMGEARVVDAPISFKDLTGSSDATGTFSTAIKIPNSYVGKRMAIHIPYEYSAFDIFIDNKLEAKVGRVGTSADTHKSALDPATVYFEPQSTTVLLTMHISSYDLTRGGFILGMKMGTIESITKSQDLSLAWSSFLIGCIFIVALFTLIIGFYRSYGKEILIFGFFCLSITLREICTVPYMYALLLPDVDWEVIIRLDYIFTCCATFFFFWLIYTISEGLFNKSLIIITNIIIAVIASFVMFADVKIFQQAFFTLYFWSFPMCIYVIYILVEAVRRKKKMALGNIIGIGVVFIAVISEFINGLGWITIPPVSFLATVIYVVIQLLFLSKQFSNEVFNRLNLNMQLQELNQSLDEKILIRTQELQDANDLLQTLANRDALTGIYNRHYFNEYMTKEFTNSIEKQKPLAVLIIDVDDFKKYNDFYGHIEGDQLLKKLAKTMDEVLPAEGVLSRFGGEEFAIVLPNMEKEKVIAIAEKMQLTIENTHLKHEGREEGIITVSIGVATLNETNEYTTVNEFINAADQNLYIGKKSGKNKVIY